MDSEKETKQDAPVGLARGLVHFYDEWEQILPADARAALKPLVDQARSSRVRVLSDDSPLVQAHRAAEAQARLRMEGCMTKQYIPEEFSTYRSAWRDAITECINAETARGNHGQAAHWQNDELAAYDRAFARLLDNPEADTARLALQGMADCMDMVRQELVEAGLIDERVPPMFVSEALLARLRQLRAAFHVNMVRAYPERTHAEIEAEINRTCWGTAITADEEIIALHRRLAAETLRADLAEARATAKSQECIELRERMAALPAKTERNLLALVREVLIAAMPRDVRPDGWKRHYDAIDDIEHALGIAGRSQSDGEIYEAVSRRADPAGHAAADAEAQAMVGDWCKECVGQGIKTSPVPPGGDDTCAACRGSGLANSREFGGIDALRVAINRLDDILQGDDGQAYKEAEKALPKLRAALERESVTVTEKGPWQVNDWGQGRIVIQSDDFTHDVALEISGDFGSVEREIAHAEEIARRLSTVTGEFYTCIGKGGNYELAGIARGAGTSRDLPEVVVYRSVESGAVFYRSVQDFTARMQKIEAQP
jgi:hypothetical protein